MGQKRPEMKINTIQLQNYRCFEDFQVDFDPAYNLHVLIAANMVGKSALLRALRVAAGTFLQALNLAPGITKEDHRVIGSNPLANLARECSIEVGASLLDETMHAHQLKWKKYRNSPVGERTKLRSIGTPGIRDFAAQLYDAVSEKEQGVLPLLLYIGTEYIHLAKQSTGEFELNGSSVQGYWHCMEARSMEAYVFDWLMHMDDLYSEQQIKSLAADYYGSLPETSLLLFEKAVKSLLPEINQVEWLQNPTTGRSKEDRKVLTFRMEDGSIRTYEMLSDGYRYLVLLAGELSTRALLLNKHLGLEVNEQINGVVLIDEFGIHLHPGLQDEALKRLSDLFPKVQFIVTTHSPMMVNGLAKEQIHILEIDADSKERVHRHPDQDIIGLGAEGILLEIFGLDSTFDTVTQERLEQYKKLNRKRLAGKVSREELDELADLNVQVGPISYERAESDPLYEELLSEIRKLEENRNTVISEEEASEIARLAIENVVNRITSK